MPYESMAVGGVCAAGSLVTMNYAQSIVELIGSTPMVKLNSITEGDARHCPGQASVSNPGGSIKDRIALKMIEEAEAEGKLTPGGVVVEPTSGNTGVGLAIGRPAEGLSVGVRRRVEGRPGEARCAACLRSRRRGGP